MKQKVLDFVISTKQGYGDSSFYYILKNKNIVLLSPISLKKENKTMNEILLRRKNKVILEKGNVTEPNNQYIVTIMKNVEALGYTFSKELFETLQTQTKEDLQKFYLELIPMLKKLFGADVVYKPMYPNFPESVI